MWTQEIEFAAHPNLGLFRRKSVKSLLGRGPACVCCLQEEEEWVVLFSCPGGPWSQGITPASPECAKLLRLRLASTSETNIHSYVYIHILTKRNLSSTCILAREADAFLNTTTIDLPGPFYLALETRAQLHFLALFWVWEVNSWLWGPASVQRTQCPCSFGPSGLQSSWPYSTFLVLLSP